MTEAKFYAYENRDGVLPITWQDFHGLCKGLVRAIYPFDPEIIIGVARGGLYPGTLLSHMLGKEFYPIRITRRFNDAVTYDQPRWLVKPPEIVKDKRVLLVDEISDSGETLRLVKQELATLQAGAIRSAVLYAHTSGAEIPDYIGLISDAVILNPWDIESYDSEAFVIAPEYLYALEKNKLDSETPFLPTINLIEPQKVFSDDSR